MNRYLTEPATIGCYNITGTGFSYAQFQQNSSGASPVAAPVLWFAVCVQQWGVIENLMNNTTFVLPTSFTYVFNITGVDVGDGAWSIGLGYVNSYTAHFWTKSSAPVSFYFVAVGYQQWGYIEQIKLEPISFLISLQSLFIVLAHSYGQAPIGTWTFHSIIKDTKITGFQLTAGQYDSESAAYLGIGGYWLIIGTVSQQWGSLIVAGNSYVTVNLNINSNLFIVTGNSSSTNKPVQTGIVSNSQISFRIMETGSHTTYWVALGS